MPGGGPTRRVPGRRSPALVPGTCGSPAKTRASRSSGQQAADDLQRRELLITHLPGRAGTHRRRGCRRVSGRGPRSGGGPAGRQPRGHGCGRRGASAPARRPRRPDAGRSSKSPATASFGEVDRLVGRDVAGGTGSEQGLYLGSGSHSAQSAGPGRRAPGRPRRRAGGGRPGRAAPGGSGTGPAAAWSAAARRRCA